MTKHTALMTAVLAVLILLPGVSVATSVSPWGTIWQYLSIRTSIDDLFTDAWQQMQTRTGAEQALNRDFDAGKQRLAAAFEAQRLIICNFPLLGTDQKAQCLNKLNQSYDERLSELRCRFESVRVRLASRYVTF